MLIKWIIVAMAFLGDAPTNSRIFLLDPAKVQTAADCSAEVAKLQAEAASKGVEIWADCLEVKRAAVSDAPPTKVHPYDKKSERAT